MENAEKQIVLVYNGNGRTESAEFIRFMLAHILRFQKAYEEKSGKIYFAVDAPEDEALDGDVPCDIIIFEEIESDEARREALRLARRANKGARFFIPLGSDFLTKENIGLTQTLITYSTEDPDANLCANKITALPDGSFNLDFVYQAEPTESKRGLRERMFPKFNQNLFGKARVNSTDRDDILTVVKAYALGIALKVENKYITRCIDSYIFESMADKTKNERYSAPVKATAPSREKEFDED